jgi:hypothetical protein
VGWGYKGKGMNEHRAYSWLRNELKPANDWRPNVGSTTERAVAKLKRSIRRWIHREVASYSTSVEKVVERVVEKVIERIDGPGCAQCAIRRSHEQQLRVILEVRGCTASGSITARARTSRKASQPLPRPAGAIVPPTERSG